MIPNPDYFEDKHPYKMEPIVSNPFCIKLLMGVVCICCHIIIVFNFDCSAYCCCSSKAKFSLW